MICVSINRAYAVCKHASLHYNLCLKSDSMFTHIQRPSAQQSSNHGMFSVYSLLHVHTCTCIAKYNTATFKLQQLSQIVLSFSSITLDSEPVSSNGVYQSGVQSDLQSLSLSDKTSVSNGGIGYKPRVEEWVRQTSQTALPLESTAEPPREITSPTPTDSSLNYSQLVCTCN